MTSSKFLNFFQNLSSTTIRGLANINACRFVTKHHRQNVLEKALQQCQQAGAIMKKLTERNPTGSHLSLDPYLRPYGAGDWCHGAVHMKKSDCVEKSAKCVKSGGDGKKLFKYNEGGGQLNDSYLCKKKKTRQHDSKEKKRDPCKKEKVDLCKKDPCKKKDDLCKKKENPSKKKEDPSKKKEEDPCKKRENSRKQKKDDPYKINDDPAKKREDPCKKKKDGSSKKKEDPCKAKIKDPAKTNKDPTKKCDGTKGSILLSENVSGILRKNKVLPKSQQLSTNENPTMNAIDTFKDVDIIDKEKLALSDKYSGDIYRNKTYQAYSIYSYFDLYRYMASKRNTQLLVRCYSEEEECD